MNTTLTRRRWLQRSATLVAAASAAGPMLPALAQAPAARSFAPRPGDWRDVELTTTVMPPPGQGATRVWVPVPDVQSDWQQTIGHAWEGNASHVRLVADAASGARMVYAEFAPAVQTPALSVSCTLRTRSRAVDWERHSGHRPEDPAVLRAYLEPCSLKPLDGIVRTTAQQATRGARGELEKVRAIYEWVVVNAHREPKVRGCGTGDIRTMLETGNLGGKCADLNAVFVGLCRAVGVPARDVYGVRVAPSAFGYRELGANPASLQGAQHCRAEAYLTSHGWVAMDPADVLKVARQETPEWIKDMAHPLVAPVKRGLFGAWEGNWVAYNHADDVRLPGGPHAVLPFLMYPQGENARGRFDELAPDSFRYTIRARSLPA